MIKKIQNALIFIKNLIKYAFRNRKAFIRGLRIFLSVLVFTLLAFYCTRTFYEQFDYTQRFKVLAALLTVISILCGLAMRCSSASQNELVKKQFYDIGICFFRSISFVVNAIGLLLFYLSAPAFRDIFTKNFPNRVGEVVSVFNFMNSLLLAIAIGFAWYGLLKLFIVLFESIE